MAYRVELTARAKADMARIFLFINAPTAPAARRWFRELQSAVGSLSEMPHRCPTIPESESYRHLLYGNKPHIYRIIFQIKERRGIVSVKSIRHGLQSSFIPVEA